MTSSDAVPLKLLKHLQQALSHDIRTPLSIISNDVQFLRSKSDDAEMARMLAQCKRIIEVLSAASLPTPTLEALDNHLAHLAEWERSSGREKGREVLSTSLKTGKNAHFFLFSEAFNEILCRDSVHAPIVDALCISMGIKISGTMTPDTIEVELIFPQ